MVVEGDARAVDQAKAGRRPGNFGDEGRFTKAHLSDPLAKTGISREFADTTSRSSRELAELDAVMQGGRTHR